MDFEQIDLLLDRLKTAYKQICGEVIYTKERKADEKEIQEIENRLGQKLPKSLRDFFLNDSKNVMFDAKLPEDLELPYELRGIFCAYLSISLENIAEIEDCRKGYAESVFNNMEDHYDKVWHNKLGFMGVRNGDVIAFDLASPSDDKPVVYLSHDDGEGHGYLLGRSFAEYLENILLIGGCGNEDWQMLPFCKNTVSGLDPFCENAVKYRRIIGYEII